MLQLHVKFSKNLLCHFLISCEFAGIISVIKHVNGHVLKLY